MKWLWNRRKPQNVLAIAGDADLLIYALADANGQLQRCGHVTRGGDDEAGFARRVRALALPGQHVHAVLPLMQAHWLAVEAPAVRPDELRAAARWRVKDQLEGRQDDWTIDVMWLGEAPAGQARPHQQLYVAAARNEHIQAVNAFASAAGMALDVIDLVETCQRNLQSALAAEAGLSERATAALVRHGDTCLLTIGSRGELFYTRRLGVEVLAAAPTAQAPVPSSAQAALADMELSGADFIDYGAEPDTNAPDTQEAPRLVVEVQRSLDLWERSWPDLPLAALWVELGPEGGELTAALRDTLGPRVSALDAERVFPGLRQLSAAAKDDGIQLQAAQWLPVLGALLRQERRQL